MQRLSFSFSLLLLCLCAGCRVTAPRSGDFACIPPTQTPLSQFIAQGKVAIQTPQERTTVFFRWQQTAERYDVLLWSGLPGQGTVRLQGTPHHIRLQRDKGTVLTSKTPEALLATELGWAVPLEALPYWLQGLPCPWASPQQKHQQKNWSVIPEATYSLPDRVLPRRLRLETTDLTLRFVFKPWIYSHS